MRSCDIHLRTISWKMAKISILHISLKIINLSLQPHLPGTNELTSLRSCHPCVNRPPFNANLPGPVISMQLVDNLFQIHGFFIQFQFPIRRHISGISDFYGWSVSLIFPMATTDRDRTSHNKSSRRPKHMPVSHQSKLAYYAHISQHLQKYYSPQDLQEYYHLVSSIFTQLHTIVTLQLVRNEYICILWSHPLKLI